MLDSTSLLVYLARAVAGRDPSLPRRSNDCCVTVELLPLDRSEFPVKLDKTDNKDGLTLRRDSLRLDTPPVRCRTGRR